MGVPGVSTDFRCHVLPVLRMRSIAECLRISVNSIMRRRHSPNFAPGGRSAPSSGPGGDGVACRSSSGSGIGREPSKRQCGTGRRSSLFALEQSVRRKLVQLQNRVHLEIGSRQEVGFVFSCPGRVEMQACPPGPAKGATGENLIDLCRILRCDYFLPMFSREQVWITNAWDQVEYEGRTRRSEASVSEILNPCNLHRLQSELVNIRLAVVCCGERAALAVCRLASTGRMQSEVELAILPHLGNQALNRMVSKSQCDQLSPPAVGEARTEGMRRRRLFRVALVAERLVAQIPRLRARCNGAVP